MGGGGGGAGGGGGGAGGGGSGALSWPGVTDGFWSRERASGLAQDAKMPIKMQAIAVVPSRSFVTHFPIGLSVARKEGGQSRPRCGATGANLCNPLQSQGAVTSNTRFLGAFKRTSTYLEAEVPEAPTQASTRPAKSDNGISPAPSTCSWKPFRVKPGPSARRAYSRSRTISRRPIS